MDPTIQINKRVGVLAVFNEKGHQPELAMPIKMKYQGRDIVFKELGLRHPTTAGRRMVHVFDMSDGVNDYRLEFDAEALTWTLVAMIEGKDVRP
jgi:hypothetical protein